MLTNIQSKIEFCVSLFPQEFIKEILERDSNEVLLISILLEGIYKSSNMFLDILNKYWEHNYNSIYILHEAKHMIQLNVPMRLTDYEDLLYCCEKDLDLIDVSIIHSVRQELNIVKSKETIRRLIMKLKLDLKTRLENDYKSDSKSNSKSDSKSNSESNSESNLESNVENELLNEENINLLSEYFISCQYYRNMLKNRSRVCEFKRVIDEYFKILNPSMFSSEHNLIQNLELYMDLFISTITSNFMINQSYKNVNDCSKMIRKDLLTRDIREFNCIKLLFCTFDSDSLKPFIWFDSKFECKGNYDGSLKSFEELINIAIEKINKIDNS